jgi:hypothetical protein
MEFFVIINTSFPPIKTTFKPILWKSEVTGGQTSGYYTVSLYFFVGQECKVGWCVYRFVRSTLIQVLLELMHAPSSKKQTACYVWGNFKQIPNLRYSFENFLFVCVFVSEDINTPICGKEEEGCTKLARSKCSNKNFDLIYIYIYIYITVLHCT